MVKVTITFEYNEENDGMLTNDDWDKILSPLDEYANNLHWEERKVEE